LHTTGTEGCVPTATGVIAHVTESAVAVDALTGPRVITIIITATGRTARAVVDAEGCLLSTACIIGRVTDDTGRVDTLLSIAITVSTTGDTRAAVGGTEGRVSTTSSTVTRITSYTGLVDTLAGTGVSTIQVGLAANTAQDAIIIGADGCVSAATLIRT